ncbi:TPA: hypothetical protein ACOJPK_001875 [Pseudomonas putida]
MIVAPAEGGRLAAVLLGCVLLAGLGGEGGVWLAAGHYRPLLDHANGEVSTCKAARDNLSGLAQEQGKALGDLTMAANARQAGADKAVGEAKASAGIDYAAATRLQQEHTGGDQCAAATSIIDKELGL